MTNALTAAAALLPLLALRLAFTGHPGWAAIAGLAAVLALAWVAGETGAEPEEDTAGDFDRMVEWHRRSFQTR